MLGRDCDSCRSAPGAVYCQADSAVLCAACDADVHSANLISHRHHRVPMAAGDEYEAEYEGGNPSCNYADLFGEDVDEYLDLVEFNDCGADEKQQQQYSGGNYERVKSEVSEGVVPVRSLVAGDDQAAYSAALRHGSVYLSSVEVNSIVPEVMPTDISTVHVRPPKGTIELFSCPPIQVPTQLSTMDREARVLRYREKKKTRKFEKTIRYASRKAYAEARPRIKGRFAKRSEVELEVDQMFSNYVVPEESYGIVPSF